MSTAKKLLVCLMLLAAAAAVLLHLGVRRIGLQGSAVDAYYRPGIALYQEGQYSRAEKVFHSMLGDSDEAADDGRTHYWLGLCLLQEGKLGLANESFHLSIKEAQAKPADPPGGPYLGKARAALAWLQQHPNWNPSPAWHPFDVAPPKDFAASAN